MNYERRHCEGRIESDLKAKSEVILKQVGLDMSSAIKMFLSQVVMHQGLPFDVKVVELSNATQRAIRDSYTGAGVESFDSVEAMLADAER